MLIELLDSLTIRGHLNGWRRVEFREQLHEVGTWQLQVPLTDSNRGLLAEWATFDRPGISIRDEDTGWRVAGPLSELRIDDVIDEGTTWTAGGPDFNVLLADRLVRPHPVETDWWRFAEDAVSGAPEGVADSFVHLDLGRALAPDRVPPWNCVVTQPPPAAATTTVRTQGLDCLRLIRELLTDSGYYLQRSFVPDAAGGAELQWEVVPQPVSSTRFSARDGNIQRVSITRSAAEATEVIGVGVETAAPVREVRTASGHDATWLRRYRERLENQPSMSVAELQDHVDRVVTSSGPRTTVTAVDPDSSLWGNTNDLDIGWLADVAVPSISGDYSFERLPVVGVSLTGDAGVWQRSVEFGARELRDVSRLVFEIARVRALVDSVNRGVR